MSRCDWLLLLLFAVFVSTALNFLGWFAVQQSNKAILLTLREIVDYLKREKRGMSRAEAWLILNTPPELDELRDWRAVRAMCREYGDLRAQEEREKVLAELENAQSTILRETLYEKAKAELLAEWKTENLDSWLEHHLWDAVNHHGPHVHDPRRNYCVVCVLARCREALARARAQGAEKTRAELDEVQSLIHRHEPKAHTMNCAVNQSKACDCGGS